MRRPRSGRPPPSRARRPPARPARPGRGRRGETADPDATCPACRGSELAPGVLVHFHPPGKGNARACDGKPVTNGAATGLAGCVTCPKCLATFPEPPPHDFERGDG